MPLIAKSPTTRSGVRVGSLQPRYADLRPSAAQSRAIVNLGRVISIRAQELQQERDAAVVGDLYTQWRDQDREQLGQLLQQKGKNAIKLGESYDKWFNESSGGMVEKFENSNQQSAFENITSKKREQNLDILARYQAQEGQRYKKEVESGVVIQAERDIRDAGFNDEKVAENIDDVFSWLEAANPGKNLTAKKQQYKSQLLFANMQERMDQDPASALKALEKWKDDLGEGYFALKADSKKLIKQKTIDDVQGELQEKYESNGVADFASMRKDLSKKDIPSDIKFEVRQWLGAYEAQQKNAEASIKTQAHDEEEREIGLAFIEGDYKAAHELLRKSESLKGDELRTWGNALKSAQKASGTKIDPNDNASEIVLINSFISKGTPPDRIKNYIIQSPNLTGGDKEQYLNKLESKLSTELKEGTRVGYRLINDLIIPKRGQRSKFLQSTLETMRVKEAQQALDDWLGAETAANRQPSKRDIEKKATELSNSFRPTLTEIIENKQTQIEKDAAAFEGLE